MNKYKDAYNRPIVAVTSLGLYTSLGKNLSENWQNMLLGKSGISKITRFETENLSIQIAGCINNEYFSKQGSQSLTEFLAYKVISEALKNDTTFDGPLYLALPPMELSWNARFNICNNATYKQMLNSTIEQSHNILYNTTQNIYIPQKLKHIFKFTGCPITLTTACASGATAINMAVNAIRYNNVAKTMAVASDGSITPELITRFSLLGVLSKDNHIPQQASKPFMESRTGFVMAEGAAALIFEPLELALKNKKPILAIVSGCGESSDSYHRTRSSPDNKATIKAMNLALKDANIKPNEINHINAHATSTIENDKAEYQCLKTVFDNYLKNISITANKSMIGHCLSAAGAIEATISILSIQNSIVPPTINCDKMDSNICLSLVANKAKQQKINYALSNSFGFGGQNSCLIFSKF